MEYITIDDIKYDLESLPEKAKEILTNIQVIEESMSTLNVQVAIHEMAKQTLVEDLSQMTQDFKKYKD